MSAGTETEKGPASAPRRARLARYGLWQLRDYLAGKGAPAFLISAMFGAISIYPMLQMQRIRMEQLPARELERLAAQHGGVDGVLAWLRHGVGVMFLRGFVGNVIFLFALFAMNGLVSQDRKQGYYRFLFSKPLSPVRYYGQAFLVAWAGFLVLLSMLALLYGAYVDRVLSPRFLLAAGIVYFMYAAIAFLMTTIVRWDWLGLATVVIAAQVLWGRFGESTSPLAWLLYLLPPIHRVGDVYSAMTAGPALPWSLLAWVAGYGAACTLAALLVLRIQRLAMS